ncbi:hypothetical protein P7K49_018084 [Saguinus oedipus]|uniref:Uncharacterized protein n=1 Tax=Saguinus oedipus TaxID=9490 RepID=A0ABQ9V6A4_SAGOE|nr:hypothetical protein P7K49_018084 [Saguinus oedipus]
MLALLLQCSLLDPCGSKVGRSPKKDDFRNKPLTQLLALSLKQKWQKMSDKLKGHRWPLARAKDLPVWKDASLGSGLSTESVLRCSHETHAAVALRLHILTTLKESVTPFTLNTHNSDSQTVNACDAFWLQKQPRVTKPRRMTPSPAASPWAFSSLLKILGLLRLQVPGKQELVRCLRAKFMSGWRGLRLSGSCSPAQPGAASEGGCGEILGIIASADPPKLSTPLSARNQYSETRGGSHDLVPHLPAENWPLLSLSSAKGLAPICSPEGKEPAAH